MYNQVFLKIPIISRTFLKIVVKNSISDGYLLHSKCFFNKGKFQFTERVILKWELE